jgi:hypothetical protein
MPRSGYGARRSFRTEGGECEDWYGKGDKKCPDPSRFGEEYDAEGRTNLTITENQNIIQLQDDIKELNRLIGWSTDGTWYNKQWKDLLFYKETALKALMKEQQELREAQEERRLEEEERKQSFLDAVNAAMEAKIRESTKITEPTPSQPQPTPESYLPLGIVAVVVIGVVLLLRRRA